MVQNTQEKVFIKEQYFRAFGIGRVNGPTLIWCIVLHSIIVLYFFKDFERLVNLGI